MKINTTQQEYVRKTKTLQSGHQYNMNLIELFIILHLIIAIIMQNQQFSTA